MWSTQPAMPLRSSILSSFSTTENDAYKYLSLCCNNASIYSAVMSHKLPTSPFAKRSPYLSKVLPFSSIPLRSMLFCNIGYIPPYSSIPFSINFSQPPMGFMAKQYWSTRVCSSYLEQSVTNYCTA